MDDYARATLASPYKGMNRTHAEPSLAHYEEGGVILMTGGASNGHVLVDWCMQFNL